MNATSIRIECEEDGFHLIIDGDSPCEGYTASILDFNIQAVAVDLLAACERVIAPWHREGMGVLSEMKNEWHSVRADHYDNREKLA